MPLLNVFTSAELPSPDVADRLLKDLSAELALHLDKPERYVMTSLLPRARMTFGGSTEPACYVEVKSIGTMSPEQTQAMSRALCARLSETLHVPGNRIYIEFANAEAHLWGHDGETFA
jgi:phenylpyruvate tautomerase PptA (4-oxalocrotonate tautomerase family)